MQQTDLLTRAEKAAITIDSTLQIVYQMLSGLRETATTEEVPGLDLAMDRLTALGLKFILATLALTITAEAELEKTP